MGKKVKGKDLTPLKMTHRDWKSDKPFMSKYRLSWDVPYTPGTVEIVAYTEGKEVARQTIKTAGKPHHIELEADRNLLASDGKDISLSPVNNGTASSIAILLSLNGNLSRLSVSGPSSAPTV